MATGAIGHAVAASMKEHAISGTAIGVIIEKTILIGVAFGIGGGGGAKDTAEVTALTCLVDVGNKTAGRP